MISPIGELLLGIVAVFASSVLYTNVIENVASRMKWSHSFAGTIVSPLFTSFPELVVFVVSVFGFGGLIGHEIGIGTIIGEPFLACSISFPILFVVILISSSRKKLSRPHLNVERSLYLPFLFVAVLMPVVMTAAFIRVLLLRYLFGIMLISGYVFYLYLSSRGRTVSESEQVEETYFSKFMAPKGALILQAIVSLGVLFPGSILIVDSTIKISEVSAISPLSLSIIIIPIATILPETIAAMIWAYKGMDTYSIGSLIGEEVLYATFYPGFALFVTPWYIDKGSIISIIGIVIISSILIVYTFRRKIPIYVLSFGLIFLAVFLFLVF